MRRILTRQEQLITRLPMRNLLLLFKRMRSRCQPWKQVWNSLLHRNCSARHWMRATTYRMAASLGLLAMIKIFNLLEDRAPRGRSLLRNGSDHDGLRHKASDTRPSHSQLPRALLQILIGTLQSPSMIDMGSKSFRRMRRWTFPGCVHECSSSSTLRAQQRTFPQLPLAESAQMTFSRV